MENPFRVVPLLCSREVSPPVIQVPSPASGTGQGGDDGNDVVVPSGPFGGGFVRDSTNELTHNRYLYWQVNDRTLRLSEVSFDVELAYATVNYEFASAILPGVVVHEVDGKNLVVNLSLADGSLFRLAFDDSLAQSNTVVSSLFTSNQQLSGAWATGHNPSQCCGDESIVFHGQSNGAIVAHCLPFKGIPDYEEVNVYSPPMMNRLFGLMPSFSGTKTNTLSAIQALRDGSKTFLFALSSDLDFRVFSVPHADPQATSMIHEEKIEKFFGERSPPQLTEGNHKMGVIKRSKYAITVAIFLSAMGHSKVLLFQVTLQSGDACSMKLLSSKPGLPNVIVDMKLSANYVWVTWMDDDKAIIVSSPLYKSSATQRQWIQALPDQDLVSTLTVPMDKDPREIYTEHIFQPNLFSLETVSKALQIFNQTVVAPDATWDEARQQATKAVEVEIRRVNQGRLELEIMQFREEEIRSWSDLLRNCIHYHNLHNSPQGLFTGEESDAAFIVTEDGLALLRPCDHLESLYYRPDRKETDCRSAHHAFRPKGLSETMDTGDSYELQDQEVHDILAVMDCIDLISSQAGAQPIAKRFAMKPLASANETMSLLLGCSNEVESTSTAELVDNVCHKLQQIHDLPSVFEFLLNFMKISRSDFIGDHTYDGSDSDVDGLLLTWYRSNCGIGYLAHSLAQCIRSRMFFARDVLLTLVAANRMASRVGLDGTVCGKLVNIIPIAAAHVSAIFGLQWMSCRLTTPVPQHSIEANIRQFSAMSISGDQVITAVEGQTVLALAVRDFLSHSLPLVGGVYHNPYDWEAASISMNAVIFSCISHTVVSCIAAEDGVLFAKMLLNRCQSSQLLEYSSMLEQVSGPMAFVCAQAHLLMNNSMKAKKLFKQGASSWLCGDINQELWMQLLGSESPATLVDYYVKVMRFYEGQVPPRLNTVPEAQKAKLYRQFLAPQIVLDFAEAALTVDEKLNTGASPMLWANMFKYNLCLGYPQRAFMALMANPDDDARRDCLQQLVGVLCERKDLHELCELPFSILADDVRDILLAKARNMDVLDALFQGEPNYYEILYSFAIFRGDYRAAGDYMYQYASRLAMEKDVWAGDSEPCIQIMEAQCGSYLAAINALSLVSKDYAWLAIVLPSGSAPSKRKRSPTIKVPVATDSSDEENEDDEPPARKLVEMRDLQQAYSLVKARLDILRVESQKDNNIDVTRVAGPGLTAESAIILLVDAGLFDSALSLSNVFSESLNEAKLEPIFTKLSDKCVQLTVDRSSSAPWLAYNDYVRHTIKDPTEEHRWKGVSILSSVEAGASTLTSHDTNAACDAAWQLLELLLSKYDTPATNFQYHRCVTDRVLSLRPRHARAQPIPLPSWLLKSYKRSDPSMLLRLYLKFSLLDDAVNLVCEYVDANLGIEEPHGGSTKSRISETFGVAMPIHGTSLSSSVWLPYTLLDELRSQLDPKSSDHHHQALHKQLQNKLDQYFERGYEATDLIEQQQR